MAAPEPAPELILTETTLYDNASKAMALVKEGANALSKVPYVKAIAGICYEILLIREQVVANMDLCNDLIKNVRDRSVSLIEVLEQKQQQEETIGGTGLKDLEQQLERYERLLVDIHTQLKPMTSKSVKRKRQHHPRYKRLLFDIQMQLMSLTPENMKHGALRALNREQIRQNLLRCLDRLKEFDSIFNFQRLANIEFKVERLLAALGSAPSRDHTADASIRERGRLNQNYDNNQIEGGIRGGFANDNVTSTPGINQSFCGNVVKGDIMEGFGNRNKAGSFPADHSAP